MPQPGWYPDPDGTPRRVRWWDGDQWTVSTQDDPVGDADPADPGPARNPLQPRARSWAIVAATVALVAGTAAFGPSLRVVLDARRAADDVQGVLAPSASAATQMAPSPIGIPAAADAADACDDDHAAAPLTDAGLALDTPAEGWRAQPQKASWMSCGQTVAAPDGLIVVSLGVGATTVSDPQDAAREIWEATVTDTWPQAEIESAPTRVAGLPAWEILGTVGDGAEAQYVHVTVTVVPGEVTADHPSVIVGRSLASDPEAVATLDAVLASARRAP